MDEALDLVRRELGQDAIVVDAKEIPTRRKLPWLSAKNEIEVSAESKPQPVIARQSSVAQVNQAPAKHPQVKQVQAPRAVRTLAEVMSQPRELFAPIPDFTADFAAMTADAMVDSTSSVARSREELPMAMPRTQPGPARISPEIQTNRGMIDSLQSILERLEQQSRTAAPSIVPDELAAYYYKLAKEDVSEEIARDLISRLQKHGIADASSSSAMSAALTATVEREIRCAPPIQPRVGHREIVTLVGPTGVGKTTTIAKLAGRYQLQEGLRVGLITVDTYRVAAIDQLQTYAEILQIPLRAATTPDELRAAIDELDNVDLILIDTAGRSPKDSAKMQELANLLAVAASSHVMLVLSLAAGGSRLVRIADQFSTVSPTSIVVTKLDECDGCGGLLSIARDIPYPIRYVTTGQDVPDQIEPAQPSRLARLIVGTDRLNSN